MVMERVQEEEEEEDTAEASTTQCTHNNHHDHHKPTTESGICPFCLQEKLTKLVSSSSSSSASPFPVFASCPSPPSPTANSYRSEHTPAQPTLNSLNITHHLNATTSCRNNLEYNSSTRSFLRIPFVQTQKKKNKNKDQEKDSSSSGNISLSRSKSTTTPRSRRDFDENTPRKRGFFRSLVSLSRNPSARKVESRDWREEIEESTPKKEGSLEMAAFDGKVSRSRSVSCGGGGGGGSSRSFSGDFFDRISTGFGDCALRRAESYRESKPKIADASHSRRGSAAAVDGGARGFLDGSVKCGGIFGGFMPNSSSSSSSFEDGKAAAAVVRHGRSKSWGWAFASPLRALNYMQPPSGRREGSNRKKNNNTSPNIHAIPSILVFRGG